MGCPFCSNSLEKTATRFPTEFWPEGIIARGQARVFPNRDLFHTHYRAVLILGTEHHVDPREFTPEALVAGLEAAQTYFQQANRDTPGAPYQTVN
jgi:hypothetical protein